MEQRSKNFTIIALGALIAFSAGAIAQSPVATGDRADNTATNMRDRGDTTKPTDQSNSKQDIQVAATVRRAIVADKTLSTKAHNVKLVANSGAVTLRGPVENDAEKTKVEAIAKSVAGVTTVNNDLDVKNTNN